MLLFVVMNDIELKKIKNYGKVVLVSKALADKYDLDKLKKVIKSDYDFGGDSDVIADVVTNEDHYFFSWLEENKMTLEVDYGGEKQKLS